MLATKKKKSERGSKCCVARLSASLVLCERNDVTSTSSMCWCFFFFFSEKSGNLRRYKKRMKRSSCHPKMNACNWQHHQPKSDPLQFTCKAQKTNCKVLMSQLSLFNNIIKESWYCISVPYASLWITLVHLSCLLALRLATSLSEAERSYAHVRVCGLRENKTAKEEKAGEKKCLTTSPCVHFALMILHAFPQSPFLFFFLLHNH